jgi:hypothetical protein
MQSKKLFLPPRATRATLPSHQSLLSSPPQSHARTHTHHTTPPIIWGTCSLLCLIVVLFGFRNRSRPAPRPPPLLAIQPTYIWIGQHIAPPFTQQQHPFPPLSSTHQPTQQQQQHKQSRGAARRALHPCEKTTRPTAFFYIAPRTHTTCKKHNVDTTHSHSNMSAVVGCAAREGEADTHTRRMRTRRLRGTQSLARMRCVVVIAIQRRTHVPCSFHKLLVV